MTRICCFCETWGSGGIEAFLLNTFESMDRSGLEIDVVSVRLESDVYLARLKNLGIDFYCLSDYPSQGYRKIRRNFCLLHGKRAYDVIHLNIFHAFSMRYLLLAETLGIKLRIVHSHNTALRRSRMRPIKLTLHRSASLCWSSHASKLWACSKNAADFMFPSSCASRVQIVPDGIPASRYAYNPEKREEIRNSLNMASCYIIGQVGRLCPQKNQSFTLRVFARIISACPEARLILVGEGEELEMLQCLCASLGISDYAIFYGFSNSVEELMQAMDVLIMPSLFEGLGMVAIEAQTAGLPVVCSDCVPQEAKITENFEFLSLSESTDKWAEHILRTKGLPRGDGSDAAVRAGFDSCSTAEWIRRVYCGKA